MMSYTPEAVFKRADDTVDCGDVIGLSDNSDAVACLIRSHDEFDDGQGGVDWLPCAELFAIVIHGKEVLDRAQCFDRYGFEGVAAIQGPATERLQDW